MGCNEALGWKCTQANKSERCSMAGVELPLNIPWKHIQWKNTLEWSASEKRSLAPAVAKGTTAIISWMKYAVSRYGLSRDSIA